MGLRDLVIKEENKTSFLVSDKEEYENPRDISRFQVHGPVKNQYVVTEHSFGSFGNTRVLDILSEEQEAIQVAHLEARKCAKEHSIWGVRYEDRTSFRGSNLQVV